MLIRVEGRDLPGRAGPDNVHVALQGRKGQNDLYGLVAADRPEVCWEVECQVVPADRPDLRGPQIHGTPGQRFIYLTWGKVEPSGSFTMFRRAKLRLDAVPDDVMARATGNGLLTGRLGLTDARGGPLCASVRPPLIEWTAGPGRTPDFRTPGTR